MSRMWIVRDLLENVSGPYDTQEILSQIKAGDLSGDEYIASYPEGSWKKISTEPEFFDFLLSVLTEAVDEVDAPKASDAPNKSSEDPVDDKTLRIEDLESVEAQVNEDLEDVSLIGDLSGFSKSISDFEESLIPFDQEREDDQKTKKKEVLPAVQHRAAKGRPSVFEDRQAHTIQHLENLKAKEKQQKKIKMLLYLLFVLGTGLLMSLFLIDDNKKEIKSTSYKLRLPEQASVDLKIRSAQQRDSAIKAAIKLIAKDEVESLIKSQKVLQSVLLYESRNRHALLHLCSTNYLLWPYTDKTAKDLIVVSELSKRSYSTGQTGDSLIVCRLVEKILYSKNDEAMQMADSYLNAEDPSGQVSFYLRYFKGLLLFLKSDLNYAVSFLESSVKIESTWIPSLKLLGEVYKKLNRSQESYNIFKRILKLNPKHAESLYQMAILNLDYFGKPSVGLKFFERAESVSKGKKLNDAVKSRAHSSVAKYFLKRRRRADAMSYAEKAFAIDPSNVEAKNILIATGAKTDTDKADRLFMAEADQLFNEGEWKAAIAIYEQAYMINKKNAIAAIRISECYWKQSFVKDAVKWAELSISADPKRDESYIKLAEYLINQYELVQAGRVLAKARYVNKANYKIYRYFAQIEFLKKRYELAEKYAKDALRLYSSDADSILILAKSLNELGEVEKAFANMRAAMEVSRSSFALENFYTMLLMQTQGLAEVQNYISGRLEASSGDARYKVMMSNAYYEDEQYREAASLAKDAYGSLEGEFWEGVVSYANALGSLNKIETALDLYQKAFLMKPTDQAPLFKAGKMLFKAKRVKAAIKQYERIYEMSPNYPELMYHWADATKALALINKDKDLALEAVRLAKLELEKNPSFFESHLLIADSYYILGGIFKEKAQKTKENTDKYSEVYSSMISWYKLCTQSYRKAIDLSIQTGSVYIDLARCQRLSGGVDSALASAKKAEEIDGSNPRIWLEIGLLYEQKGSYRAATKAYENFLSIFPNAPNKSEISEKIKELKALVEED